MVFPTKLILIRSPFYYNHSFFLNKRPCGHFLKPLIFWPRREYDQIFMSLTVGTGWVSQLLTGNLVPAKISKFCLSTVYAIKYWTKDAAEETRNKYFRIKCRIVVDEFATDLISWQDWSKDHCHCHFKAGYFVFQIRIFLVSSLGDFFFLFQVT